MTHEPIKTAVRTLSLKKDTGPAASRVSSVTADAHLSCQRERRSGPSFVRVTERGGEQA